MDLPESVWNLRVLRIYDQVFDMRHNTDALL